ncbi:MFS family permease [Streptomyces sp. V3I8]|uniref:MFS transporter n=1 Tax=Streptomyces sp. V3I8 TaxID=3042279 RepID=UPI00277FE30B|nr:MFS transporter [Streptomyces sp. V3I8]MDQ1035330.1 MFS family permease [Streptomyces sp. V3I8]
MTVTPLTGALARRPVAGPGRGSAGEPATGDRPPRSTAVIVILAATGILVAAMQTLIVPLVPELPELLHTSPVNASWAITATLLGASVAVPVAGRLGDLYGTRRLLLISITFLIAGSVLGALAGSLPLMVTGRTLQGFGTGAVPLGISIMREVLPAHRLGSGIAVMSSSLGVGAAIALPLSAAVAQQMDWHTLFWVPSVLGLVVALLILWIVPASPPGTRARFDAVGALGLAAGLVCLFLAVSLGGARGWGSETALGLLATSVAVLTSWAWWELRHRSPLVDLRASARRPVLMTNLASVMIGFAMYAQALAAPQLLHLPVSSGYGLGRSMVETGLWLAPAGLAVMAFSPLAARLSAARGPRTTLVAGSVVVAAGYGTAAFRMGGTWDILMFTTVIGAGVSLAYAAMPALIMDQTPASASAAANGLNSLARSLGTAFAGALTGVVLVGAATGPPAVPSEADFRTVFLLGAVAALLAAVCAIAVPAHRTPSDSKRNGLFKMRP